MIIRDTGVEDIEEYTDLILKTWRTTYKGIVDDEFMDNKEKMRDELIKQRKNEFGRVEVDGKKVFNAIALEHEKVVGFVAYGKMRDEKKYNLENAAEIYAIYVLKDFQRKGIGRKMINFALKKLVADEGYDEIVIWALSQNPNIPFYLRIGGADIGLKKSIEIGSQVHEETGFLFENLKLLIERLSDKE